MLDEIGGYDAGFRMYGEDIDLLLPRRTGGLGALVRARPRSCATAGTGSPTAAFSRGGHSGTGAGCSRFVRKHPERLKAL